MQYNTDANTQNSVKSGARNRLVVMLVLAFVLLGGLTLFALGKSGTLSSFSSLFSPRSAPSVVGNPALTPSQEGALAVDYPTAQATLASGGKRKIVAGDDARQAAQRAEEQGGLDTRVAAMEQRLTRLDIQLEAAGGNAARAEGLLIAFAARRAIERGAPLGYLADQLRLRFGDARPNAVQAVLNAGQHPVTRDQLLARLEGLAPVLTGAPDDEGWFTIIRRELSQLFVVRREDTPSPANERRLERARLFIESGRARPAVAEIRNLPNAIEAQDWIADAQRYAAAQEAIELLETTAVLERRDLRDGSGERVEQLSPAIESSAQE